MKAAVPNTDDEIDVIDEKHGHYGRIRIRENQGISRVNKCSIFLTPDQLEEHAKECLALASKIRTRQTADALDQLAGRPSETERAHYLGMSIEQYRKAFSPKGSP